MLECTRGYSIDIVHVKGTKNRFTDALSRQPITDGESVPEFPMFAGPCVARTVYGVKGEPEFGLDMQKLAVEGAKCDEYQAIIDFVNSGKDVKNGNVDKIRRCKKTKKCIFFRFSRNKKHDRRGADF